MSLASACVQCRGVRTDHPLALPTLGPGKSVLTGVTTQLGRQCLRSDWWARWMCRPDRTTRRRRRWGPRTGEGSVGRRVGATPCIDAQFSTFRLGSWPAAVSVGALAVGRSGAKSRARGRPLPALPMPYREAASSATKRRSTNRL